MSKQPLWSREEIRLLRSLYPQIGAIETAALMRRSTWAVRMKARAMGLTLLCSKTWTDQESTELRTLYPSMPTNQLADRLNRTISAVHSRAKLLNVRKLEACCAIPLVAPIGTERHKNPYGYLMRKVTNTRNAEMDWIPVHRIVWEESDGPIPERHCVIFRDGDRNNIALNNLRLVSQGEMSTVAAAIYHSYPKELRQVIRGLAKLKRKIAERQ